jgi:hypothetical protein
MNPKSFLFIILLLTVIVPSVSALNFTPEFNTSESVHINQTYVLDRGLAIPLIIWAAAIILGVSLTLLSFWHYPQGVEGLISILAWFPLGFAAFTAFAVDVSTTYGATASNGAFVLLEQHTIYSFPQIAVILLVADVFAIGNSYRIWATQKRADEDSRLAPAWHDRHGGLGE